MSYFKNMVTFGFLCIFVGKVFAGSGGFQDPQSFSNRSYSQSPGFVPVSFSFDDSMNNVVTGDVDRLLKALNQDPSKLTERRGYGLYALSGEWYWAGDPSLTYETVTDNNGNKEKVYKVALNGKEKRMLQEAQYKKAIEEYKGMGFASDEECLQALSADIQELKDKIEGTKNSNLKKTLEDLFVVARSVQTYFKGFAENKKIDLLSKSLMPVESKLVASEALIQARNGLKLAIEARDESLGAAYRVIISQLENIDKEIQTLKINKSLEESLDQANSNLLRLQDSRRFTLDKATGKSSFDEQIKLYENIIASLKVEVAKEAVEEEKHQKELESIIKIVDSEISLAKGSARDAHVKVQEDLKGLEESLQRLKSFHNPSDKKNIKAKELEIRNMYRVVEHLHIKAKEEEEKESRQERKVDQMVDVLLVKYDSNLAKAIAEALTKIGSNKKESAQIKIEALYTKIKGGKKLSEDERVVLQLDKKIKEAKKTDPFNIAVDQLSRAKVVDVPLALEAVVAAMLGKAGLSIDKLDDTSRQSLADMLKETSGKLIQIMQNPSLPESRKQQEKQIVVKTMLNRVSILMASGISGASEAALKTGNASTIITDIALNQLINKIAPTAQPAGNDFDLSAFNTQEVY